jgi:DNA-binding XRE family transcriptional regulator
MNKLAGRIAELGLQKQWVAEQVGISRSSMSNLMTGKTKEPSLHVAIKLARVLGTTVEKLWGDEA